MSRAIDADALEPDADYYEGDYWAVSIVQIHNAPTIEPERKKGRWIAHPDDAFDEWFCCSVCHKGLTMFDGTYNFCPNCGAEMTEGEECQSS